MAPCKHQSTDRDARNQGFDSNDPRGSYFHTAPSSCPGGSAHQGKASAWGRLDETPLTERRGATMSEEPGRNAGGGQEGQTVEDMLQDVMDFDLLETKHSILNDPPPAPHPADDAIFSSLTPHEGGGGGEPANSDLVASSGLASRRDSGAPQMEREESLGFLSEQVGRHARNVLSSVHAGRRASIQAPPSPEANPVTRERVVALKERVEDKIDLASRYRSLILFLLYCTLYVWVLYDQTDTNALYVVENSILSVVASNIDALQSPDIYTWLEDISNKVFKDPVCGDGLCEDPLEFPGLGRFGCESDCGRYPNTTTVFFTLSDPLAANPAAYPLATSMGGHPDWAWNAFSKTMGSFVFAEDQAFGGASDVSGLFDVPDGELEVCIYQRNKLYGKEGFQPSVLGILGNIEPQTLPAPEPRLNYDFGDPREALALHAGVLTYLTVPRDNPSNTTLTQAPAITARLQYGFFGGVGKLGSGVNAGQSEIMAYFTPCSLTAADITAANLGDACPVNFIYPRAKGCFDGARLLRDWSCDACKKVDIRSFTAPGEPVRIRPIKQPKRPVTPFNYLIGGIAIEQKRGVQVPCAGEGRSGCGPRCQEVRKRIFGTFYEESQCINGSSVGAEPFGIDPAFLSSSSIFSGKLHPSDVGYEEGNLSSVGAPFGFFATSYDIPDRFGSGARTYSQVNASETGGDTVFRVYMDARFGSEEVRKAMAYLREGYFLDNLTRTVDVSFFTFNPIKDVFALCTVSFDFLDGGQIESSVFIKSRALSDFHTTVTRIIVMSLLVVGSGAILRTEVSEVLDAWKRRDLASYFGDPWNLLDVMSFISIPCSIITYDLIGQQVLATFTLARDGQVPYVLYDVNSPARIFRTDPVGEMAFLESVAFVRSMMSFLDFYSVWVGINVMILTGRFFKILHFQGRMGLVTRTFASAVQDIIHFGLIFFLVIFAYGVMGVLLFGHQLSEYRTMERAMMTLIQATLAISDEDYARMLEANNNFMTTVFYLSFLFLSTITLLNIFLAILIDAFGTVKESSSHSETLVSGLSEVLMHDVRHMQSRIVSARQGDGHPTRFIPDHQLKQLFEAWAVSLEDESTMAAQKAEKEKEEEAKDGILRLDDGTEMGAAELAVMMLHLISEAPDKIQELYSGQKRHMQLRSAISNFVSMAPGASGRGHTVAPEMGNSVASVKSSWKSPSNVLAVKYWERVRDIFKAEEGVEMLARDVEEHKRGSNKASIHRLAKGILARYGEDTDAEPSEDESLKIIQAQVLQKQVQQFQRTDKIEERVQRIEAMVEKMAFQIDRLAGGTI